MEISSEFMTYELQFVRTSTSVGYFSCVPDNAMHVDAIIAYLRHHPNDQFMYHYLLFRLVELDEDALETLVESNKDDPLFLVAAYQSAILYDGFHHVRKRLEKEEVRRLGPHTPLIFIRWALDKDRPSRCFWMNLFCENVYHHKSLPPLGDLKFPIPFDFKEMEGDTRKTIHIGDVCLQSAHKSLHTGLSLRMTTAEETVEKTLDTLLAAHLSLGTEKRTVRSLSPYALERTWQLNLQVSIGRNRWMLRGSQTSYGKGLDEDGARASYLMEMVERYSSFASFSNNQAIGYKEEFHLVKSTYSHLQDKGSHVLDPNIMNLEVPYEDQELYWIVAEAVEDNGRRAIYVPAQFVFLFCNLDEISLTSGISSNGLAAGNTMEEAKLHALTEYIERDSERVALYCKERCFLLEAEDPTVNHILNTSKKKGLHIQFLDLTSDLGIPCYKSFVQTLHGDIVKGCAADLNGQIAAVSALTELAYPHFVRSMPPPAGLKTVQYEQLPNYSSGDVRQDLYMLEKLLLLNGLKAIYVDLTRKDLDIPVVRAFIPGLELMAILDRFSNFNKRQFRNYLKMMGGKS